MNGIPLEHITEDEAPLDQLPVGISHVCMVCLGRKLAEAGDDLPWGWARLSINTSRDVEPVVLCGVCVAMTQCLWSGHAKAEADCSDLWFKVEERRAAWEVAS